MKKPHPLFFSLQELISDLSLIDRDHHVLNSGRAENDIVHSFSVAMLCWFIVDEHNLKLDLNRVLKYALIHDFVERYAGDINTYASNEDRLKKVELEKAALVWLSDEFKGFPSLVEAMNAYEARSDDEALFVWTVDKLQALVLADLDNWRPYKKIGISYDRFEAKHNEQLQNCSPYCKDIFASLLEYFKTTYYDQPKILPPPPNRSRT